jgi:hypothetical protein
MIKYTYDFEVLTMSTVFMNAMSDIVVKRFNKDRSPKDQIKTRIVYAPKQRVLLDLLDKDQNLQLPVISVTISGVSRDESRVFNKQVGVFYNSRTAGAMLHERAPLPVDINYTVSIMTKYQEDMDQIISHIIPYVNPYFVVSWRTPQRQDFEIRSNVFWNGQCNITYPVEIGSNTIARCVAELTFTFKGWIFKSLEDAAPIFTIDNTLAASENFFLKDKFSDTADNFVYDAVPVMPRVVEPYFVHIGTPTQFRLWGSGFEKTQNVYLSGAPIADLCTIQNPFSGTDIENEYPSFTAFKLPLSSWKSDPLNNLITFNAPPFSTQGHVDVIVENLYSYGNLISNVRTLDSSKFTPPTVIEYVPPYINGISVN